MRLRLAMTIATFALVGTSPALAAPCKDRKTGKFIKCPDKASTKPVRCKGAQGKFAKCSVPGAKPV